MVFPQMKHTVITVIRQAGIIQNVDRHAFLQRVVIASFWNLAVIHLGPVKQRSLLHVIRIKQLHLDVQKLALRRLGLYIHDRLFMPFPHYYIIFK
jgi:hypothetical protein